MNRTAVNGIAGRLLRLWADDAGGEVIEYALILGLIAVVAIAVIAGFGTKVLARWTSVNSST
jgi:Flp pilus assembly pilin Flp